MTDYAILLGGEITQTPRLRNQLAGRKVVAADSGIRHAKSLNLDVDRWVGDFDSSSDDLKREFAHVKKDAWSSDKDLTDSEIAIHYAAQQGARSILLVGAFGGRTDHATNHLLAAFALDCELVLTSGSEEAMPVIDVVEPDWPAGTTFSILAFDDLEALSISGAIWPLDRMNTKPGSSLTISNEVTENLTISLDSGRAFVIGLLEN